MRKATLLLSVLAVFFLLTDATDASIAIYPAPAGARLSADYIVKVDGQAVSVYRGTGRTRYGGNYSFAYFDFSGAVRIEIKTSKALGNLVIRPESKGIVHTVSGNKITFSLSEPCSISIEPNGRNGPLLLFANPLEVNSPNPGDPGVIYFATGMHNVGEINVAGDQWVYIAGGAVVNGWIRANGSPETGKGNLTPISNVKVTGRGILDSVNYTFDTKYPVLQAYKTTNLTVEGVILKDSRTWSLKLEICNQVTIDNVKIIGTRFEMEDGISFNNSKNVTVQNSFIRTDDDCLTTYGLPWNKNQPIDTITVTKTVLWTDRAYILRMGLICQNSYLKNFTMKDIDVIHLASPGLAMIAPNNGITYENLHFENIRINFSEGYTRLIWMEPGEEMWHAYSLPPPGKIKNVYWKNVTVGGTAKSRLGNIVIYGPAADQNVDGVTFENVMRGGVLATRNSLGVSVSGYANNINFVSSDTVPRSNP